MGAVVRSKNPQRLRQAFTLVELFVVIGIIALLISILLPALNSARRQANLLRCQSNLRQMGQAIQMYVQTNKGMLPFSWWDGTIGGPATAAATDFSVLLSNTMGAGSITYATNNSRTRVREMFHDVDTIEGGELHYSGHPRLLPNLEDMDNSLSPPRHMRALPMARVKRTAEVVMIMDGVQIGVNGNRAAATCAFIDGTRFYDTNYLLYDHPKADNFHSIQPGANLDTEAWSGSAEEIRWRHLNNTAANFLFADGHVEARRYLNSTTCGLLRANVNVN